MASVPPFPKGSPALDPRLGGVTAEEVVPLLAQIPMILVALQEIRTLLSERSRPLLTVEEVAELVSRSPYTIRAWVREGRLQATRIAGTGPRGRLLIAREELEKLVGSGLGARVPAVAAGAPRWVPVVEPAVAKGHNHAR